MSISTIRAAFAGGVGAAVVMTAGAALAGSGVGGVFNLGRSNAVNATSALNGTVNGPQLSVSNGSRGSSAAGLHIATRQGRSPITVSGTGAVARNLNADKLDGRDANTFSRVSSTQTNTLFPFQDSSSTIASVTITVPKRGFVVLNGTTTALATVGCDCNATLYFHDPVSNSDTPKQVSEVASDRETSLSITATLPASAGTHTYTLTGGTYAISGSGQAGFYNVATTALYVPFNGTGTTRAPALVRGHAHTARRTTTGIVRR